MKTQVFQVKEKTNFEDQSTLLNRFGFGEMRHREWMEWTIYFVGSFGTEGLAVLIFLLERIVKQNCNIKPSNMHIAVMCALRPVEVQAAIDQLCEAGVLELVFDDNNIQRFYINF